MSTVAEVRALFTRAGGQLAGAGSVAWQFEPRGVVAIPRDGLDADEVALTAIDAGADDVDTDGDDFIEVLTDPTNLDPLRRALEEAGVRIESAEVAMQPKQRIEVGDSVVRQNLRLLEQLDVV